MTTVLTVVEKKRFLSALKNAAKIEKKEVGSATELCSVGGELTVHTTGPTFEFDQHVGRSDPSIARVRFETAEVVRWLQAAGTQEVTVRYQHEGDMQLTVDGKNFYRIQSLPLLDTKKEWTEDWQETYGLTAPQAKEILTQVLPYSAVGDSAAYAQNIMVEMSKKGCRFVSSDGFRLALAEVGKLGKRVTRVVVPKLCFEYVPADTDWVLSVHDDHIHVTSVDMTMTCETNKQHFPEYQRVMGMDPTATAIVDGPDLFKGLKPLIAIRPHHQKDIRLQTVHGELEARSQSSSGATAQRRFNAHHTDGEIANVIDGAYLSQAAKIFGEGLLTLESTGEGKPLAIKGEPVHGVRREHVIMTMRDRKSNPPKYTQ